MKLKEFSILCAMLFIITILFIITFLGIPFLGSIFKEPLINHIKLGLDIKGGVSVTYEVETPVEQNSPQYQDVINQTKSVISQRINSIGLTEPNIYQEGKNRIVVEIPGVSDSKDALEIIGKTAKLEFAQVKNNNFVMQGESYNPEKMDIIFGGEVVKTSKVVEDRTGKIVVSLSLNEEGAKKFAKATKESIDFINPVTGQKNGQIAIMLDRKVISAPMVSVVISNGECVIQGNFSHQEANNLSLLIKGGALPAVLKEVKTKQLGPTLGIDALKSTIHASVIAIFLIFLFMILYYRLLGVVASISLVLYSTISVLLIIIMNQTLTLPGMCGFVLSIGMAVDANVIIYERIREEIRNKKGLRAAVEHGFHKTMTTILDSNITTIVAAVVLFNFGEGSIKGFAITLIFGVLTSMFTAVFVTKNLLMQFVKSKAFSNINLYVKSGGNNEKTI